MDGFGIGIHGDDAVLEALRGFGSPIEERIVNQVGKLVMAPVEAAMRANAPVDEGHLKEAISTRSKRLRNGARSIRVGVSTRKFLSVGSSATSKARRKVPHNYARILEKRKPFLRPAWDQYGGERAREAFVVLAGREVEKRARFLRRKAARAARKAPRV